MKKIYAFSFFIWITVPANSQTPTLYKDIFSYINFNSISGDPEYTTMGNTVFFTATDPVYARLGKELWKSDGTEAGTVMVKDIIPGNGSSSPKELTEMNGNIYFSASALNTGNELWKSDGTEAGTVMVKDISAGNVNSNPINLKKADNLIYFTKNNNTASELWKTDGTEAGTVLVKQIKVGYPSYPVSKLTYVNGLLYFAGNNGINGFELWKSDGTEAGTVMVKDIYPGATSSNMDKRTIHNGQLYFVANNGVNGIELWKTDGTEAGTIMLKDINTGVASSSPFALYSFAGSLYFSANDITHGYELWKSDGTQAGTQLLADINVGTTSSHPNYFKEVGNILYFIATTTSNGNEIWKTDGTTTGTVLMADLNAGSSGSFAIDLINFQGTLYFYTTGSNFLNLWKSDGTAAGTIKINEVTLNGGAISYLYAGPNKIYFVYRGYKEAIPETASGAEPWVSNGTDAGTILLKDINLQNNTSNPFNFCKIGNLILFTANNGLDGIEIWKTDGSTAGTELLKNIRTGSAGSNPGYFTNINNQLFFSAYDEVNGYELWKSDGTTAGTVLIKDIMPGINGSTPTMLKNINGTLYFSAIGLNIGRELWKSDGTAAGTVLVKDIMPGNTSSNPNKFTYVNGTVFFTAQNGTSGVGSDEELWKTDGTDAGTTNLNLSPNGITDHGNPYELTPLNNNLIFTANDFYKGFEMWRLTGSAVPLNLLNFSATKINQQVALNWQTNNEINTALFEIERATNSAFEKIGEVPALNSAGNHNYIGYDPHPKQGINLYRLKMLDIDGQFTYSNIKKIIFNTNSQIQLYPNPASTKIEISNLNAYQFLQIADASGKIIFQQKITKATELISLQKFAPGMYLLRLSGNGITKTEQFIKQ